MDSQGGSRFSGVFFFTQVVEDPHLYGGHQGQGFYHAVLHVEKGCGIGFYNGKFFHRHRSFSVKKRDRNLLFAKESIENP